jgi:hypothetical protein
MFALHRCVATIALIPGGVIEHAALGIIAQSPRPLLSWNRYLPDVLRCGEGVVVDRQSPRQLARPMRVTAIEIDDPRDRLVSDVAKQRRQGIVGAKLHRQAIRRA